jgi:hypothetical protein
MWLSTRVLYIWLGEDKLMSFERLWPSVTKTFISNGTARGTFQVSDYAGLYVKQLISLTSTSQPSLQVQIKRIEPDGTIYVGGATEDISHRVNISQFLISDSATAFAAEQLKTKIKKEDQDQASYESEPINARRVIGVDAKGNAWSNTNPLPVISGGEALPYTDDIKIIRDSSQDPIRYEFYLGIVMMYYITVSYDTNKNAIEYKTTVV